MDVLSAVSRRVSCSQQHIHHSPLTLLAGFGSLTLFSCPENKIWSLDFSCRPNFQISGDTANVYMKVVTNMHVTQVLMLTKRSDSLLMMCLDDVFWNLEI